MKKAFVLSISAFLFPFLVNSQNLHTGWGFGGKVGIIWNGVGTDRISNLPETYFRRGFDSNTFNVSTTQPDINLMGGLYYIFRFNQYFALQADLSVLNLKMRYDYQDIEDLKYYLEMNRSFASLGVSTKIVLIAGVYVRPGLQFGLDLTPNSITYCHEAQHIWGNCQYIEEELNNLTKEKGDVGGFLGIGYELPISDYFAFNFEIKYYHGFGDVIDGKPNSYGFDWTKSNYIRNFQFSVGVYYFFERNRN